MSSVCLAKRLPLAALVLAAVAGALLWGQALFPGETAAVDGGPEVIASIHLGTGWEEVSLTDDSAVDSERNRIYFVNNKYDGEEVFIIDGATNTISDTIVPGVNIYGIGVNPTTNRIYLSVGSSADESAGVQVIDGDTKAVLHHVEWVYGDVAVDPVANRIFTHDVSGHNDLLAIIDGSTHELSTVSVGSSPYIESFIPEVNPQTGLVYASYGGDDMVTVVDPAAEAVVTRIDIGAWPGRPFINPQTNRIYLQNHAADETVVVDGSTHGVVARIAGEADAIGVNPATNRIYRANDTDVEVIDGATNSVVTTFSWTDSGRAVRMAVNPQTGRLYIAGEVGDYPRERAVVVVQDVGAPAPAPTASPTPLPPAEGMMHNCPQPGKWAISVWEGQDGTDTGQALATCGGAVAAAYRIDPGTQAWSGWFAGRPEISQLASLDDGHGVIALGQGVSASSASGEELLRAAANGMLGCPQPGNWAISVWQGEDGTEPGEAMATCGEGTVAAAYYLDPGTQVWSGWFAGRTDISNLSPLSNNQGFLTLGAASAPTATPTATPTEETAYLPPPQEVGEISAGGNAVLTITNDTPYTLTLEFQGPTSQTLSIGPCDTCSEYSFVGPFSCPTDRPEGNITLPPGTYDVTARVDDPSVIPFAGDWTLEADTEYFHCFYIVTTYG